MDRLSTLRELSEVLGCSERAAQRLAQKGQIPCYRLQRSYRVRINEVLEALRVQPADELAVKRRPA